VSVPFAGDAEDHDVAIANFPYVGNQRLAAAGQTRVRSRRRISGIVFADFPRGIGMSLPLTFVMQQHLMSLTDDTVEAQATRPVKCDAQQFSSSTTPSPSPVGVSREDGTWIMRYRARVRSDELAPICTLRPVGMAPTFIRKNNVRHRSRQRIFRNSVQREPRTISPYRAIGFDLAQAPCGRQQESGKADGNAIMIFRKVQC